MRRKGISQVILSKLELIAKSNDCYKIILDCDNGVKKVYMKSGFNVKGVQMAKYF